MTVHIPVLLSAVLETLGDVRGRTVIDATFGAGGYSRAFLARGANVIAFDRDASVQHFADELSHEFGTRFRFINAPFSEMKNYITPPSRAKRRRLPPPQAGWDSKSGVGQAVLTAEPMPVVAEWDSKSGVGQADAIVFDLGVSSMQIDTPERGFSFRFDAPLDMRMGDTGDTATTLIKNLTITELARILRDYGDVVRAVPIARAIKNALPTTTLELRNLIYNPRDIAPVFQALRIAVNDEMGEIERALADVPALLAPHGICAVVTFHSLEDRLVKNIFREWTLQRGDPRMPTPFGTKNLGQNHPTMTQLKTMKPTDAEVTENPRARSAHMRAVRKTI